MTTESRILHKLNNIEKEISDMKKEMKMITEYIEDRRLTARERKLVGASLEKIKKGDKYGFISHEKLKKELGL